MGWQEPEGHLVWQREMPRLRGCGSKTVWRWGWGVSTLMVSRARSRMAHCFGVRFRVSSRTMWSWNHRESNSVTTAGGCRDNLAPTCQPRATCSSPFPPRQSPSSDFLPSRQPPPHWSQKDPTHLEYREFGKMAQLLGSSEDQLGALGREETSQKQRTPNLTSKYGLR